MIKRKLIDDFQNAVNENDYVLFKYRDVAERNQWNCICSAMDWITVAVEHICTNPPKNPTSIQAYAYISSVDIIVEAVCQLHRVLLHTSETLFGKENTVFQDNQFNQTDLVYFKTIRACFGAHPVNLDEPNESNDNHQKRRFASWSGDVASGSGAYSVILYSNQVNGDNIFLEINFAEIDAYLEIYYNYLHELMVEIRRQYHEYIATMRKQKFECTGSPLSQLLILEKQSAMRRDNTHYRVTINQLVELFSTKVSCDENQPLVEWYRSELLKLVDEIRSNLQHMTFVDLTHDDMIGAMPTGLPNGWGYWVGKLSEHIWSNGYLADAWVNKIEKIFGSLFVCEYETYDELYLLVQAALYRMYVQQNTA